MSGGSGCKAANAKEKAAEAALEAGKALAASIFGAFASEEEPAKALAEAVMGGSAETTSEQDACKGDEAGAEHDEDAAVEDAEAQPTGALCNIVKNVLF